MHGYVGLLDFEELFIVVCAKEQSQCVLVRSQALHGLVEPLCYRFAGFIEICIVSDCCLKKFSDINGGSDYLHHNF